MTRAFVGGLMLVTFGAAVPGWAADQIVMGAGTLAMAGVRVTTELDPPCVQLVTRTGSVQFTGVIATENGQFASRTLREACADPAHGTFHEEIQLTDATVDGITGNLIIAMDGTLEGDVTTPSGARIMAHGTVSGVSGNLKGATGLFQMVGQSVAASSFNTYYLEIHLKK